MWAVRARAPRSSLGKAEGARDLLGIGPGDSLLLLPDVDRGIAIARPDLFEGFLDHALETILQPPTTDAGGGNVMTVVSCRDATGRFGALAAVGEVSLQVEGNEVFGVIGPNGFGKTTLLDCLSVLDVPTSGPIDVLGLRPV